MDAVTLIKTEFGHLARQRGGITLYPVDISILIIERCKELNIPLWGIEGFFLASAGEEAQWIRPSMEHSIDYTSPSWLSMHPAIKDYHSHAVQFLSQLQQPQMMFEVGFQEDYSCQIK